MTRSYVNDYPLPESVECPFCAGTNTRIETPFGSVLSVAQYYCLDCRTIFEWVKRQERAAESG